MQTFDLTRYGISGPQILRNLSPAVLYEEAIRFDHKSGELDSAPLVQDDYFGLAQVTKCSGVLDDILLPAKTWPDQEAYRETASKLASEA